MGPFLDPRDLIIIHGPDHSQQTHEAEICNAPSIFKPENSPKGAADMPGSDDRPYPVFGAVASQYGRMEACIWPQSLPGNEICSHTFFSNVCS